MTTRSYSVTYDAGGRPKIHRAGCADVTTWEFRTGRAAWDLEAADDRAAQWQAGEEQRQVNADPNDLCEDPGADLMPCLRARGRAS